MRLFVAIRLKENVSEALGKLQVAMKRHGIGGNYTPTKNMHVTLAFIGEYSDPNKVLNALSRIRFSAFPISLNGSGNFHDVWWTGLDNSEKLDSLAESVRKELKKEGIPFDSKPFSSHITILRKPEGTKFENISSISEIPSETMEVSKVSLMESTRGKYGMMYTELGFVSSID